MHSEPENMHQITTDKQQYHSVIRMEVEKLGKLALALDDLVGELHTAFLPVMIHGVEKTVEDDFKIDDPTDCSELGRNLLEIRLSFSKRIGVLRRIIQLSDFWWEDGLEPAEDESQ